MRPQGAENSDTNSERGRTLSDLKKRRKWEGSSVGSWIRQHVKSSHEQRSASSQTLSGQLTSRVGLDVEVWMRASWRRKRDKLGLLTSSPSDFVCHRGQLKTGVDFTATTETDHAMTERALGTSSESITGK
ncbi:hypothetical protein PAMA_012797 [Pampus argenteus]